MGGGSVLGGHGTLMSTAGMSNSTVGGGMGAPPGSLLQGGGGIGGANGVPNANVYGNVNGNGGVGGVGQNTGTADSRAVSVVVTLPGGPGSQHPGQALSDYGPI
ncbi:fz2 [Drosophila busckii]|uniref:Fz2 n=1 Tax=Drosophila busckii TaxID=30019 RepID=A0A0M3QWN2_DROBS|nr:fz2 [Drosophila busckii]